MQDVRDEILGAATRLFAKHGFDGTSVQSIAEAVGIRKPSLLYHFPSKDELRRSVLDQMLDHWNQELPRLLLAAAREERFEKVMESLVGFFLEDPDRARLIVRESLDRPSEMNERLGRFVRPWVEVVADQLARARDKGLVQANIDPQAYAVQVINMVVGGVAIVDSLDVLLPNDPKRGTTRERHVRELIRMARSSLYVPG
ncbi:MAG: TetR/AcrR family transcriptional regulator [Myxococcales bacterium]|nr:TetR/AcrR family transcriptional regulator [Myxococcales bacterium]MCB9627907.1 TetR/AcrR family transcriptional regulator [Sandaracinaceae bacterium]